MMDFTTLLRILKKTLLPLFACVLFSSFLFAQKLTFQSTCVNTDSIQQNAFSKGCITGWEAANGQPSFISNSSIALLASQEGIRWRKSFEKCAVHHIQATVLLSSAVQGKVSLSFTGANATPFSLSATLNLESAGTWISLYWLGIELPHSYEGLQLSFEGINATLQVKEVQARTECPASLDVGPRAVGELSAQQVSMTNFTSSSNERLHVKAAEGVVLSGEVTLKEGSDVVLSVAPCPTENNECVVHPKEVKPLVIYNFLSPNGDGQNDTFFIEDLDEYPNAELVVLSKLGKVVYHAQPYKNDWNGGNEPKGLYTYQLRLEQGLSPLKGELLLER